VVGILAAVGALLAIVAYIAIPDTEEDDINSSSKSIFSSLHAVLTNWKVIIVCISSGLMVGPLEGFADIWGPKFLSQCYNIDASKASYLTSMIFMGMCFGAPVLNFIAGKLGYMRAIILSGITMFFIFIALVAQSLDTFAMTVCFILVGVCSSYQILAIYKTSTYVSKNTANLATALANMIIMIFGYAFHGIIGVIINASSRFGMDSAFCYGIMVIPAALLMGVIGFIVISRIEAGTKKSV
jgi:predicted MFS family arabinose efflux permease